MTTPKEALAASTAKHRVAVDAARQIAADRAAEQETAQDETGGSATTEQA